MVNNTFELKKGKLVFEEDKILITDNARYLKRSRLLSSGILILFGLYNLMNFLKHNDIPAQWSGLLVGIFGLIFLVIALLTNAQSEIYLKDVKSMKVRRIFFKEYLVIKLANNRTRQVAGIYNAERLEEYIKTISLPK
ncbi:MAG: hypothetical protein NTZ69_17195 [Bacteroidia bacterium]|nr:hypothetical protein [Bacteroidia bacterium]